MTITTQHRANRRAAAAVLFAGVLSALAAAPAKGQLFRPSNGRHQPLNHNLPPGVAGYWAGALGRATPGYLQPVRVELPTKGNVTFIDVRRGKHRTAAAPALARFGVGFVYRFQISDMPEFPGVSLYPSVEVIDRLHPPRGKADEFPIPLQFTADEIALAAAGRMVTKVVYLEQPQLAVPDKRPLPTASISPHRNLLLEADRRGRPMAIIRLGSRLPDVNTGDRFFGRGGPLQLPQKQPADRGVTR